MIEIVDGIEFTLIKETESPDYLEDILADNETVIICYKTSRDSAVITNKRFILTDSQGLLSKKVGMFTIPFRSIKMYSTENGHGDTLLLFTNVGKITIHFKKKADLHQIERAIANYIL